MLVARTYHRETELVRWLLLIGLAAALATLLTARLAGAAVDAKLLTEIARRAVTRREIAQAGAADFDRPARPVAGAALAATTAGFKESGRPDLALLRLAPGSRTAGVFTRNAFLAAPVRVARAHLATTEPQALLINSGCANAGSGAGGLADAERSCVEAGRALDVGAEAVLPFSTGVIGPRLGELEHDRDRRVEIGGEAGVDDLVVARRKAPLERGEIGDEAHCIWLWTALTAG